MGSWTVGNFSVVTATASGVSDELYANGRMQVLVTVLISARDSDSSEESHVYHLTDQELKSIGLMDYYTNTPLQSHGVGWTVTKNKGVYAGSLSANAEDAEASRLDDSNQSVQLWVSTTHAESKNIGAYITQPDGQVARTSDSSALSRVTLIGKPPIIYTYPENMALTSDHVKSGKYNIELKSTFLNNSYSCPWKQVNYYLTTSTWPLLRTEIKGYDRNGSENGHVHDPRLTNCYAYKVKDSNLSIFFMWQYDQGTVQSQRAAGLRRVNGEPQEIYGQHIAYAFKDIEINQRKNSLCLTHLKFDNDGNDMSGKGYNIWGYDWSFSADIVVYDIYGNAGYLKAKYTDDYNAVDIKNSNP